MEIIYHSLGATNQRGRAGCPVVLEELDAAKSTSDQLDRLVKTHAKKALFRRTGGIPGEETLADLLLFGLTTCVAELPIGQEVSHIQRRVAQASIVEIDQCQAVRRNPDVFRFEVTVYEARRLLGQSLIQLSRTVEGSSGLSQAR